MSSKNTFTFGKLPRALLACVLYFSAFFVEARVGVMPSFMLLQAQNSQNELAPFYDYIAQYKKVAITESKKLGMPASIKLAQAILESNAGRSKIAQQNNNHFGIKCREYGCLPGHCSNFFDDSHHDFFVKFGKVSDSYQAHNQFLQKERYKHLFKLSRKNYKAWAMGLEKAGYASGKDYGGKLIRLIERFDLHKLDVQ